VIVNITVFRQLIGVLQQFRVAADISIWIFEKHMIIIFEDCDFSLEEFNQVSAILACYIENLIGSPFVGVIAGTFSHVLNVYLA
jgi:hypothetical protein